MPDGREIRIKEGGYCEKDTIAYIQISLELIDESTGEKLIVAEMDQEILATGQSYHLHESVSKFAKQEN